jgi:hypothetical protein
MDDDSKVLFELPKNRREVIRLTTETFKGQALISLRIWATYSPGDTRPTRQGLSVRPPRLCNRTREAHRRRWQRRGSHTVPPRRCPPASPGMAKNQLKRRLMGGPSHVRIHAWVMRTTAWQSLTPKARVVLVEIAARYFGTNNGRIALSVRDAAEACNINKDTAGKAFQELIAKGFLVCKTPGGFTLKMRHATEWLWTEHRDDVSLALPLKTFVHWRPKDADKFISRSESSALSVPSFRTEAA